MRHYTVQVSSNHFAFQYCNTVFEVFVKFHLVLHLWARVLSINSRLIFICRTYSVEDSTYPDDHLQGFHFPSNGTEISMIKNEGEESEGKADTNNWYVHLFEVKKTI